ncbi:GTPase domain-containing protein [Brevibacterium litoralis]|uniref:GTPase domain-containing protein n=1 Tax=Brevibacterium litoralis TaxID=3138935 RepID=UPI0032EC4304
MTTPSIPRALSTRVVPALTDLAARVAEAAFPFDTPDAAAGRALQRDLGDQLNDYLLPRAQNPDAPVLVVVGGSTGAGKSTLVNSVVGKPVTAAGVIRPTTHHPVLVHHPADAEHFTSDRVLPSLERVVKPGTDLGRPQVRLVASDAVPRGLALLDSPDIDSVDEANRTLARQLLAAADLWLFVTTATRYADAVPWDLLGTASQRGTTVSLVLDRVPAQANREVRHHLAELLSAADLGSAPIFTVPELALVDGLLPEAAVFPVRSWLFGLGTNSRARERVVSRTLTGALATVPDRAAALSEHVRSQEDTDRDLRAAVDRSWARARETLESSLVDGRVLRGEVLARWQDFVGTGQFFRGLEPTVARIRDRITSAVTGKRDAAAPLEKAIGDSIALLVRENVHEALGDARDRWEELPAGRALLQGASAAIDLSADFETDLDRTVREWSTWVNDLVRQEGQGKRAKARILSFGVNAVGAVLMLAAFSGTGGLTGAEAGIAGGTAAVSGKLLDTIFGDQVTRDLTETARAELHTRIIDLVERTREPFDRLLAERPVPTRRSGAIAAAASRLEENL